MGRFANLELQRTAPAAPPPSGSSAGAVAAARSTADYLRQADLALARGRHDEAMRCYSRCLEFDPNQPAAWAGQVRVLLETGQIREAGTWATKAMQLFPEHPDLLAARALACLRLGESDDALAYSDAAVAAKGAGVLPWLARGEVVLARRMGRDDWCFGKAFELARGDWAVALAVARAYLVQGAAAKALDWAQKGVAAEPACAWAWHVTGTCRERLGLDAGALEAYRQAFRLDPGLGAASEAVGRMENRGILARLAAFWIRSFRR